MVTSSHLQLNLITESFIPIGFALKLLVRERDCWGLAEARWKTWVIGISIFHILVNFPEVKIPVIVVLTKFDVLFYEHYRDCLRENLSPTDIRVEAANRANRAFINFY